jgi:DNA integrity scanning protein DisA with diadenylate cyclase activity
VVHEIDAVLFMDTSQHTGAGAEVELKKVVADMKQKTQDLERLGQKFDEAMRTLEKEDRLGNFQIQELMSDYNRALELHSRVLKTLNEIAKESMRKFD